METLALNTALDPSSLVTDRDEWVHRLCEWMHREIEGSFSKKFRRVVGGSLVTSEWHYHGDTKDVIWRAHFAPRLLAIEDPSTLTPRARKVWQAARKRWPEVLKGVEFEAFCAAHIEQVDTRELGADEFAKLMRNRK